MKQLTLDLHADAPPVLENFVAAANADLLAALYEAVPVAEVPQHLFLWGDAGSGRSHLLRSVVTAAAQAGRPACYLRAADVVDTLPQAQGLLLAIDDVEASLRTAELVRRHFPHVQIVARARNRFHASRLMDLGIQRQIRETLPASFEMARWTLELLHEPPALAEQLVSRFARHDAELLARQQAIAHDESQLIQSSRESRDELAQILEEARAAFARKERGAQRAV